MCVGADKQGLYIRGLDEFVLEGSVHFNNRYNRNYSLRASEHFGRLFQNAYNISIIKLKKINKIIIIWKLDILN